MFRALHRLWVIGWWCFWGALALLLYGERARLQPALDYAELAWRRDQSAPAELPVLTGTVTRVHSSTGFQVRDATGTLYNYGLTGVGGPPTNVTSRGSGGSEWAERATASLNAWLVGEPVRIEVTLSNPATRTGLGLTRLGATNVNERLLAEGLGVLRRDQIRGLPLETQYELVRAERLAREQRLGVWQRPTPAD